MTFSTAQAASFKQTKAWIKSEKTASNNWVVSLCQDNQCYPMGKPQGYSDQEMKVVIPQHLEKQIKDINSRQMATMLLSSLIGGLSFKLGKVALATLTSILTTKAYNDSNTLTQVTSSLEKASYFIPILAREDFQLPSLNGTEFDEQVTAIKAAFEAYDYTRHCEINVSCRREITRGMPIYESMDDYTLMKYSLNFLILQKQNFDNYINGLKRNSLRLSREGH